MKTASIFLLLFFQFSLHTVLAQEKFDLITYKSPKGWQKDKNPNGDALIFTKQSADGAAFSMITFYKSIPASDDANTNFNLSWEELAQKPLNANQLQLIPVTEKDGWIVESGLSEFQKDDLTGAALLLTATSQSQMVNILYLTNTDIFQKEVEDFLESVELKDMGTSVSNSSHSASSNTYGKPELWVNRRLGPDLTPEGIFNPDGSANKLLQTYTDFYVIYPNGDFNPNVPYEGLLNFNPTQQPESWGKFTMQGKKGRFKSNYDDIAVTKKSDVMMEKDGSSYGFYKFLPVDGLRIEGSYTHVASEWGKDPQLDYLDGAGCQYVIHFKKDGTFDDKGIFSSRAGGCQGCNCQSGKGTYHIENFTITFKYQDGRTVTRLFSAPPTRNPFSFDDAWYMGQTVLYKKNNKLFK